LQEGDLHNRMKYYKNIYLYVPFLSQNVMGNTQYRPGKMEIPVKRKRP
jgi:hypothetical protein